MVKLRLLRLFEVVQRAADGRFLAGCGVGVIDAVGRGSVDDGDGLGQELLGKRDGAGFDGGGLLLDRGLHSGLLDPVLSVARFSQQNTLFRRLDIRQTKHLLQQDICMEHVSILRAG